MIIISASAYIIPNVNILIVTGGSIFGTTLNIILPVLFYNRAYTFTPKNKALEGADKDESINIDEKPQDGEGVEEQSSDPRCCVKTLSWIAFTVGIIFGIFGLVFVIMDLTSG